MGRYSKKRKQEEARMRAENAKKTFVENILEFSEKQLEELERLERRINRKKILINKKYRAAYDKIQKEEREKRQKIFEKYDRYIEKRRNEIIAMYIGAGEDMAIWLHGNSLAIIWTFTRAFLEVNA